MTRRQIDRLDRITWTLERLQRELVREQREVMEPIAKAKDLLIDAMREVERRNDG